jgi:hypothetical protein
MFLLDQNNRVVASKGGTKTNGELLTFVQLPSNSTYKIVVTSEKPGDIGRYSLALKQDRVDYILDRSGELTNQSPTLKQDGSPFNMFEVQGQQNQVVTIRAESVTEDFSPYICLLNSQGQVIAWSNGKNTNSSALIDPTKLPKNDTYYVIVNSLDPKGRGKYRLTVY